jgi:glutaredoxin 3
MTAPIVIYVSPFCGYCSAAKKLLEGKSLSFTEIDVLFDPSRRDEMIRLSGRGTVPQIFVGDRHIGGFDDLRALETSGELDALLEGADGP